MGLLMNIIIGIFIAVAAGLILYYSFGIGNPNQSQPVNSQPTSSINPTNTLNLYDVVDINELRSNREIYNTGENASVRFSFIKKLNINYSFKIEWLYNGSPIYSWTNSSSETPTPDDSYSSWYNALPGDKKGEWIVHLVLNYSVPNYPNVSKDKTTTFQVI